MPDKMTPERALIVLNQCNTDGRIKVDREELKQAVKMASEAIKRRIPMKPIIDCYTELVCSNCKTHDNPQGNYEAVLNYAFVKDDKVLLRYANEQENIDLCDYIAFHAKGTCGMSAQEVLDGSCFECDDFSCSLGRAYIAAVQAAELREKLKIYEDLAEQALKGLENYD